jgi:signal transduction histidine kinase
VQLVVFKAVREFLVNTVKHAGAQHAVISIETGDAGIEVEYRDDGCGFDPVAVEGIGPKADAFGLFNVRERCEYLGGHLSLASAPGQGACLRLAIPLGVGRRQE